MVFKRTFFFSQPRHSLQRGQGRAKEGPRLFTNLVAVDNVDIEVGMPVEIVFNDETEVKFRPVGEP